MKNNLLKKLFSSGLQAIAVQVLGGLFIFVIPFYLSKDDFGLISKMNANCLLITTLLSFGMEQVVFRRIAASTRSDWASAAYLAHAVVTATISLIVILIAAFFINTQAANILPWIFIAQAFIFSGTPLKLLLNAKQRFAVYGVVALISNGLKLLLAFACVYSIGLSIYILAAIMILCSLIEFGSLLFFVRKYAGFVFKFKWIAYTKLLKESLPQYISAIFDSSLSRIDWILLGIIATNAITADYSLATKAYEIALLPTVVIAPIILAKLSKLFGGTIKINDDQKKMLNSIFSIEIFVAILIPLVLNILWVPALDFAYNGKYGASNALQFLILSINIPLKFAINLLWTISFTGKAYKRIARITIASAIINVALNLLLIPMYGGTGAAIAFLISTLFQFFGYYIELNKMNIRIHIAPLILLMLFGAIAFYVAQVVTTSVLLQLLLALFIYISLSVLLKQINKTHYQTLQYFLKK